MLKTKVTIKKNMQFNDTVLYIVHWFQDTFGS